MLRSPVFWLLYVDVRHGRGVGPDGDGADRADRQGFRPRRPDGDDLCSSPRRRSARRWSSTISSMAWRGRSSAGSPTSSAARTPWGSCSRSARVRLLGPRRFRAHAVHVHPAGGADLLHLGRNLQPVPVDRAPTPTASKYATANAGAALHRQGHRRLGRAAGELSSRTTPATGTGFS